MGDWRKRIRGTRIIALLVLCLVSGLTDAWAEVYVNRKFGYSVDVPSDVFEALPEEADGRAFVSRKDSDVRMRFFAASGVSKVPDAAQDDIPPGAEKVGVVLLDKGYLLRYRKDEVAFVLVRRLEGEVLYSALFECPVGKTGDYDAICSAVLATWSLPEENK
ncbi:MAG: hypothetical protein LBQ90_08250 [Synergistaceae bacterium]|nr:hypothetical protein [Synergistaceae bacterium]